MQHARCCEAGKPPFATVSKGSMPVGRPSDYRFTPHKSKDPRGRHSHTSRGQAMRLLPSGDRRSVPFLDDARVDVEVAVADPGGPHGAVAITFEIMRLDAGQLGLSGNLRNAFVLHGAFVLGADNEGDTGILY